jgi:hypothetical protein
MPLEKKNLLIIKLILKIYFNFIENLKKNIYKFNLRSLFDSY